MKSTSAIRAFVVSSASIACLTLAATCTVAQTLPVTPVPAEQCLKDLHAFGTGLQKDGYWLDGSGNDYMFGYGYAYEGEQLPSSRGTADTGYWRERPGYEVRTLLATAGILAQLGKQESCETLLATTRAIYASYTAQLRSEDVPRALNRVSRRLQQIAAAVSVTDTKTAFRSDQLIGVGVVNMKGQDLGTVDDIVMNPRTGKIAYLMISRGGIFGIGMKYVPVPWTDFKAAAGAKLMVLATTMISMDDAPHVQHDRHLANGSIAAESLEVDDYWDRHLSR